MSKEELIELIKETVTALNAAHVEVKTEEVATSTETPVEDVASNAKPKEGCCECGDESKKKEETVVSETPDEEEKPDEGKTQEEKEVVEETVETKEEVVEKETTEDESDDEDDEKERKTKVEKEEPEVIKIEALNSRPVTLEAVGKGTGADWRSLHGKEFFDYLSKHKAEMVDECRD